MPIPRELREELEQRRRAEHGEASRDTMWDFIRAALECWVWLCLGVGLIAWSIHTTSQRYAGIAFWAGLAVGNGGIIFTILGLYRRGESRGDW